MNLQNFIMPKYFWLIILTVIGFVLYANYYPASDLDTDTSNWPLYRNERYGFTIKYPPGWRVAETGDLEHDVINFSSRRPEDDERSDYKSNIIDIYRLEQGTIISWLIENTVLATTSLLVINHNGIEMTKLTVTRDYDVRDINRYIFGNDDLTIVFSTLGFFAEPMLDSFAFLD